MVILWLTVFSARLSFIHLSLLVLFFLFLYVVFSSLFSWWWKKNTQFREWNELWTWHFDGKHWMHTVLHYHSPSHHCKSMSTCMASDVRFSLLQWVKQCYTDNGFNQFRLNSRSHDRCEFRWVFSRSRCVTFCCKHFWWEQKWERERKREWGNTKFFINLHAFCLCVCVCLAVNTWNPLQRQTIQFVCISHVKLIQINFEMLKEINYRSSV